LNQYFSFAIAVMMAVFGIRLFGLKFLSLYRFRISQINLLPFSLAIIPVGIMSLFSNQENPFESRNLSKFFKTSTSVSIDIHQ
jgi:hypothetical protein